MLKGRCSLLRSLFLMGFAWCSTGCDQPLPGVGSPAIGYKTGALTASGPFERTGDLRASHAAHTATRLQDGRVLIVGGSPSATPASERVTEVSRIAEIYDPNGRTFARTGVLGTARALHRAVLLNDGRVLITGGEEGRDGLASLDSAELYRPDLGGFVNAGSMNMHRQAHSATLLDNGQVLIVGGYNGGTKQFPLEAERYDPTSGNFLRLDGPLTLARQHHSATRLQDGRVLIVGGISDDGLQAPAEIYDPATGRFTLTGALRQPRLFHQATLLSDGEVLITGGSLADGNATAEAELYDPGTGTFSLTDPMTIPRQVHTATLLDSGRVLITGGVSVASSPSALASAELYDPVQGQFLVIGTMNFPRQQHTATSLGGERVLIAGGHDGASVIRTGEIFDLPSSNDGGVDADRPDLTSCVPGARRCLNDGQVATCGADGSETVSRCPADTDANTLETCVPELGRCGSVLRGPARVCGPDMTCVACGEVGQPCCNERRCNSSSICNDTNVCVNCLDPTDACAGKNCGTAYDRCGNPKNCGSCLAPETCGGGGQTNLCGCAPTSCAAQGRNCGTIPDGCGGTLDCGSCPGLSFCGGGGLPNVCGGCQDPVDACAGKNCGTAYDRCGNPKDCGTCSAPETCGGGGQPNACGCTPTTTCAEQGKLCGTIADGCGGTIECGSPCVPLTLEGEWTWSQYNSGPTFMGSASDRVCFLTRVTGRFKGGGEVVQTYVNNGAWYLGGSSFQSDVGGAAHCVRVGDASWYTDEFNWFQGQGAVNLGPARGRSCFLTRVTGRFAGPGELVHTYVSGDSWYLAGASQQSGVAASARCIYSVYNSAEYYWTQYIPSTYMEPYAGRACFLTGMTGEFIGGGEVVKSFINRPTENPDTWSWYLGGSSFQEAVGATARCISDVEQPPPPCSLTVACANGGQVFCTSPYNQCSSTSDSVTCDGVTYECMSCGDGICNGSENCRTCPDDCGDCNYCFADGPGLIDQCR